MLQLHVEQVFNFIDYINGICINARRLVDAGNALQRLNIRIIANGVNQNFRIIKLGYHIRQGTINKILYRKRIALAHKKERALLPLLPFLFNLPWHAQ